MAAIKGVFYFFFESKVFGFVVPPSLNTLAIIMTTFVI